MGRRRAGNPVAEQRRKALIQGIGLTLLTVIALGLVVQALQM